jgi:hypothetical protein
MSDTPASRGPGPDIDLPPDTDVELTVALTHTRAARKTSLSSSAVPANWWNQHCRIRRRRLPPSAASANGSFSPSLARPSCAPSSTAAPRLPWSPAPQRAHCELPVFPDGRLRNCPLAGAVPTAGRSGRVHGCHLIPVRPELPVHPWPRPRKSFCPRIASCEAFSAHYLYENSNQTHGEGRRDHGMLRHARRPSLWGPFGNPVPGPS